MASCHFFQEFALGWFQASLKVIGSSGTNMVSAVTTAKSMGKFKFSTFLFYVASLMILLASSLCKACGFFIAQNTFGLTVVLGEAFT